MSGMFFFETQCIIKSVWCALGKDSVAEWPDKDQVDGRHSGWEADGD